MCSALLGVYVVCKRKHVFIITVIILHCYLKPCPVFFLLKMYCVVQDCLVLVKVFNKRPYSAVILEYVLFLCPVVFYDYVDSLVKEC